MMGCFELAFYGWKEGAAHRFFGPTNSRDLWEIKKVNPTKMVHLTENGPKKGRYDTMPGPGGYARLTLSKSDHVYVYPDRTNTDSDLVRLREAWAEYAGWFLKILDQTVEPEPAPSATPAPIRGELAAFGIWPLGEVTVKSGEAFDLDAMGVFLNDPYEAVNLNDRAVWTLPDGLVRGPDGKVKATRPGTYTASVSIKRPDGRVMSDRIRIIVQ